MSATVDTVERWHVVGFREAVYRTGDGTWRAAGCCERCSAGIRYVVKVKSSLDGRTMDVGQDCAVMMKGGPELAEIRAAERAFRAELAREESERTRPEREARERAERATREQIQAARAARNLIDHAALLADLDTIIAAPEAVGEFAHKIASDIAGKLRAGTREDGLSDHITGGGFCEVWCIGGALVNARAGAAKHLVAEVGARVTVNVSLVRVSVFEGEYGGTFIATFRSDDGAAIVWRSSVGVMAETAPGRPQFDFVRPGDRVEMVATVKSHGEYRGTPQTNVTRAKLYRPGTMPAPKVKTKKSRKAAEVAS